MNNLKQLYVAVETDCINIMMSQIFITSRTGTGSIMNDINDIWHLHVSNDGNTVLNLTVKFRQLVVMVRVSHQEINVSLCKFPKSDLNIRLCVFLGYQQTTRTHTLFLCHTDKLWTVGSQSVSAALLVTVRTVTDVLRVPVPPETDL